jgi:hypothetical protein
MLLFLGGLFLVGAFNWYLVFSDSARERLNKVSWYPFRRSREGREFDNAFRLAASLIIAVFCSTIFVSVLIVSLVKLFK